MLEVEVKARVPPGDVAAVRAQLGAPDREERQTDVYLAHPVRDFAVTDEALRVRSVAGRHAVRMEVTYKGPKLAAATKTRRELTVGVTDLQSAVGIFEALGFRVVATVTKDRTFHDFAGCEVTVDDVAGLGVFVEAERAAEEGSDWSDAAAAVQDALVRLGLRHEERRSYLELLLAQERSLT